MSREQREATGFVGCTTSTVSHLARARVAAASWRQHHPEAPFFVLLVDGTDPRDEHEPFEVVLPEELGVAPDELAVQQAIYDAYELACALEPHLIRLLLARGAPAVIFTDTDTCFYAPVDDLAQTATDAGLVLSPTSTRPVLERLYYPLMQLEYRQVTNGLFNTGLFAVGNSGDAFLEWWAGWLARDCLEEPSAGIWTDQLWVDWAAVYFEPAINRDTSLNAGFWNLDERVLAEAEGRPTVDGAPLRHFHFAGFDPRRPELVSAYREDDPRFITRNWPSAPANPVLADLLQDYARRLLECGSEELRGHPYKFGISAGGRRLGRRERTIYREAVLAAEARDTPPPPNPFDTSRIEEFERLIDDPASLRSLSPQAQKRLEQVRPDGLSASSLRRLNKRLLAGLRYALTERPPPGLGLPSRVTSDTVRLEYRPSSRSTV